MISNGLTWSPKHLDQAKEAGLCAVGFSLDGFEKEHDAFRAPGSFERVVRAIDMCVAAGMRTAVNTTINRLNQGSLKEMRTFLMEHGVFAWQPQLATASGNMGEHRDLVCVQKICCGWCPRSQSCAGSIAQNSRSASATTLATLAIPNQPCAPRTSRCPSGSAAEPVAK
jgi:hypothetical protein